MTTVVVINGYPEAGKDEVTSYMAGHFRNLGLSVLCLSSIDEIKKAAYILGWDGKKDEKGRNFLSDLKCLSTDYYDGPYNYICNSININKPTICLVHVREPSEIEKICKTFPTKTILVERDSSIKDLTNVGDSNVNNYVYDFVIANNGTFNDLKDKAEKFANLLLEGLTAECFL